ncbi:MBL fold metallo-hydrolase [Tianweitania sp.]|uniref:MBL fold metallo-hydrolase n=1 Tax=Tianweitania sp. TaxID=2021634 RepID=UPI002897C5C3|nr:MBL fold metallo-hydrolase [Tianweitania sp.]
MAVQIPIASGNVVGQEAADGSTEVRPDLSFKRETLVNVMFFGTPSSWVLIDTGIPGSAGSIKDISAKRFGEESRPECIVLTHGHFDHVGTLLELAGEWDVPVYAHVLEHPYLNGTLSYPSPDVWAGGGIMPLLSPLFPTSPVDVGARLHALPADHSVPAMPGWVCIHTPGHTPGHVSLWRESDRTIIAGDAFITTGQESAYEILVQRPEIHGPPRYFTPDWQAAKQSVQQLAALEPDLVLTGHGQALSGAEMRQALHKLADEFEAIAMPR